MDLARVVEDSPMLKLADLRVHHGRRIGRKLLIVDVEAFLVFGERRGERQALPLHVLDVDDREGRCL